MAAKQSQKMTPHVSYVVATDAKGRRDKFYDITLTVRAHAGTVSKITGLTSERDVAKWLEDQVEVLEDRLDGSGSTYLYDAFEDYAELDRADGKLPPKPNPQVLARKLKR